MFRPLGRRDHSRVGERLLLNTPGGYCMGQEKKEAGEDDQDLKLCSSQPWEQMRKVNISPVIHYLAAKQTRH